MMIPYTGSGTRSGHWTGSCYWIQRLNGLVIVGETGRQQDGEKEGRMKI